MALLICFAQCYGVWQVLILASPSRTIRWGTICLAFFAGLAICSPIALLLQLGWTHIYASVTNQPYNTIVSLAGYTLDPLIEEIVKMLPLLLVCLVPRVRNQLGTMDMVLICLALGSGFGLTEDLLRFSYLGQFSPISLHGNFLLVLGLNLVLVPGLENALASWVPSGATALTFAPYQIGTNFHLALGAVNGLALGLLLYRPLSQRKPTRLKKAALALLASLLLLLTVLVHMANNAAGFVYGSAFWNGLIIPVFAQGIEQHLLALFPLVALAGALVLDRLTLYRMNDAGRNLLLAAEKQSALGLLHQARMLLNRPRSLIHMWAFVLQRRAYLFNCVRNSADPSLVRQFIELTQVRLSLDTLRASAEASQRPRNTLPAGWTVQPAGPDVSTMTTTPLSPIAHTSLPPALPPRPDLSTLPTTRLFSAPARSIRPPARRFGKLSLVFVVLLAIPTLLYFVVGSLPPLRGVQNWLANPLVFTLLKFLLVAGLLWQGLMLGKKIRGVPQLLKDCHGQTILTGLFGIMMGAGALVSGIGSALFSFLSGRGPLGTFPQHTLAALLAAFLLVLLMMALLMILLSVLPELLALLEFNPISELAMAVNDALLSSEPGTVLEGQVADMVGDDLVAFQTEFGPGGSIGEIDVETSNAIIETTVSKSGKLSQIQKLLSNPIMNPTGKPVILYAPNYGGAATQAIINAGADVVKTEEALLALLEVL